MVPELRFINQDLWHQIKARQEALQGSRFRGSRAGIGTGDTRGACSPN
jgi:hypothetical protein